MIKKLIFEYLYKVKYVIVFVVILLIVVVVGMVNIFSENNNYKFDNKMLCWLVGNFCEIGLLEGILMVVMDCLLIIEE